MNNIATDTPFVQDITGRIEGLSRSEDVLKTGCASTLANTLTAVGQAVRLQIPIPAEIHAALKACPLNAIFSAIKFVTGHVQLWNLPTDIKDYDFFDHQVEWALRRRDDVESLLVAIRISCLRRGILIDKAAPAHLLRAAIAAHDLTCGRTLTRSNAEYLLGEHMQCEPTWLDDLTWREEEPSLEAQEATPIQIDAKTPFVFVLPSVETMEHYITKGTYKKYVECAAIQDEAFARSLERMTSNYLDDGAVVSDVATAWYLKRAT